MGRGKQAAHPSTVLYGPESRRPRPETRFAERLIEAKPQAFYVVFERFFAEKLRKHAREHFLNDYPPSKHQLDIHFTAAGLPDDVSIEELEEEQDDDLFIACDVYDNGGGFFCHEGMYLTPQELLNLGWHEGQDSFQWACRQRLLELEA